MSSQPTTVTRVLEAAGALYDEHGSAFSMEQLEAGAGVSRATIYRNVGGKSDVLRQLGQRRGVALDEPDDVRTRILDATRVVFADRGLRAATIEQIAAEAGVGVATVYRHFGDKEGLARAFMDELAPRRMLLDGALHPSDDVAADLERILDVMVAGFTEHRDLLRWIMLGDRAEVAYLDQLRGPAESTFSRLAGYVAAQMEAGRITSAATADELALALIGMAISATIVGPLRFPDADADPARASGVILDLLCTDIRGGP